MRITEVIGYRAHLESECCEPSVQMHRDGCRCDVQGLGYLLCVVIEEHSHHHHIPLPLRQLTQGLQQVNIQIELGSWNIGCRTQSRPEPAGAPVVPMQVHSHQNNPRLRRRMVAHLFPPLPGAGIGLGEQIISLRSVADGGQDSPKALVLAATVEGVELWLLHSDLTIEVGICFTG